MTKEIWLTIESRQRAQGCGGEEDFQIWHRGSARYRENGEGGSVLYRQEAGEDTGARKGLLKFTPGRLEVVYRGDVNSRMILEEGTSHPVDYATPYGTVPLTARARRVCWRREGGEIRLEAEYLLISGGEILSENCVRVGIRPL